VDVTSRNSVQHAHSEFTHHIGLSFFDCELHGALLYPNSSSLL
jgi:hypothetical protein